MQCEWVPSEYSDLPEEYVDSVGTIKGCLPGAWHNIYMHVGSECLGHAVGSAHLCMLCDQSTNCFRNSVQTIIISGNHAL